MAIDTVGPSEDYADFATREAAATGNDVEFYSGADLGESTWNAVADAGITVYPATGHRTQHLYSESDVGYIDVGDGASGFQFDRPTMTIRGLRVNITGAITSTTYGIRPADDVTGQVVDGCFIVLESTGSTAVAVYVTTDSGSDKTGTKIINNSIIGKGANPSKYYGIYLIDAGSDDMTVEVGNNTAIYAATGTRPSETFGVVAQETAAGICTANCYNNIMIDFDGAGANNKDYATFGGAILAGDYNMSSDTTAPGTTTFHNETNAEFDDYTEGPQLASDADALDAGTDRSSSYTTDGIGTARPQGDGWDLGSIETIVASAVVVVQAVRNRWQGIRRSLNLRGC